MTVCIEPQYFPSIEYFVVLQQADKIYFNTKDRFLKQSYGNRAHILGANGIQKLIVPIHKRNHSAFEEITIDNSQDWKRNHWGSLYSVYGKSAFFEHYAVYFERILQKEFVKLSDLNLEIMSVCLKLLNLKPDIISEDEEGSKKLTNVIIPKKPYAERHFYTPTEYFQNFGDNFASNLSILDLLFNEGPASSEIISKSVEIPLERFG